MPTLETLERFIARIESNSHAEALEEFYTEDGYIQENQSEPRIGRDALVSRERELMARAGNVTSTCIRPVFVNGDCVVIRWVFRFEWLDGTVTEMEEIAYQNWEEQRIIGETFFYDPAQRNPKKV
ncbi:nuclear transport factor 2 family protein [Geothrix sp. SG200]|uniref:nuclear transport factor 2 family protein n=1 Tax=Geothrix sp. SG200 TaxID=2922865 RepID=UPI001FAD4650|nr:nuclear transport factor 2 family protein [Geothrix sp. SG200]